MDFIEKLLRKNPRERMAVKEAFAHEWMQNYCGKTKRQNKFGNYNNFRLLSIIWPYNHKSNYSATPEFDLPYPSCCDLP